MKSVSKVAFNDHHPQPLRAFLHHLQFQVLHRSHRSSSGHSLTSDPGARVGVLIRRVTDCCELPCGFWEQNLGSL